MCELCAQHATKRLRIMCRLSLTGRDVEAPAVSVHAGRTMLRPMMSTNNVTTVVVARRNIAKMLIVVVCMFALCYLPVHLVNMLR